MLTYPLQEHNPFLLKCSVDVPVESIVASWKTSFLIHCNGTVTSFGHNGCGEAAVGSFRDVQVPTRVQSLTHERVKSVAHGQVHTMFLTESDKLYASGSNLNGRCGIQNTNAQQSTSFYTVPTLVTFFEQLRPVAVSCGYAHTIVLTKSNDVYTFGTSNEGQCAHGAFGTAEFPSLVFNGSHGIKQIAAGGLHSLFASNDQIFCSGLLWGLTIAAPIDVGNVKQHKCVNTPKLISAHAPHIQMLVAGGSHSIVLCGRDHAKSVMESLWQTKCKTINNFCDTRIIVAR